jgi:ribosomal protein S27E
VGGIDGKESREWMLKCNNCGSEKSVWEHGGIRRQAAGNPTRRMLCAGCGMLSAHTTHRKSA